MIRALIVAGVLSVAVVSQASAWNDLTNGVYGSKGNDTGGIIPWSPENEKNAFAIAEANCKWNGKFPVATSIHRVPGDFIAYRCQWDPPRRSTRRYVKEPVEEVNIDLLAK
jgi:hypothetical protein